MLKLKVTTKNNKYTVTEDDSGNRVCIASTHPDKEMMRKYFINQKVYRLEIGYSMLTSHGHTSTVLQIEPIEEN